MGSFSKYVRSIVYIATQKEFFVCFIDVGLHNTKQAHETTITCACYALLHVPCTNTHLPTQHTYMLTLNIMQRNQVLCLLPLSVSYF